MRGDLRQRSDVAAGDQDPDRSRIDAGAAGIVQRRRDGRQAAADVLTLARRQVADLRWPTVGNQRLAQCRRRDPVVSRTQGCSHQPGGRQVVLAPDGVAAFVVTGTQFAHRNAGGHARNVECCVGTRHAVQPEQQLGARFGPADRSDSKAIDPDRKQRSLHHHRRGRRRLQDDRPRHWSLADDRRLGWRLRWRGRYHERRREAVIGSNSAAGCNQRDPNYRSRIDPVTGANRVTSAVLTG